MFDKIINGRTAGTYLAGTFLATYLCWCTIILAQKLGYLEFGTPVMMILFIAGGFSPAIVSFLTVRKAYNITLRKFIRECFAVKQKAVHYMLIPFFMLLYYGIPALMGRVTPINPWYLFIIQILPMIIGGGLEELGWRYLLQRYLEKKLPFWAACTVTAVIWLVWHIPLFLIIGTSQQKNMSFPIFAINILGLAFVLAAHYRVSQSIWLCILCHAAMNAFLEAFSCNNSWQSALCASLALIFVSLIIVKRKDTKSLP